MGSGDGQGTGNSQDAAGPVPLRRSIATKLLKTVFALYCILIVSVTLVHVFSQYLHKKAEVLEELVFVEQTVRDGLSRALWDINRNQAISIIEGLDRLPAVVGVRVQDSDGGIFEQVGHVPDAGGTAVVHDPEGAPVILDASPLLFEHTFPLTFDRGDRAFPVGQVSLYSSNTVIFERIAFGVSALLVNALFQVIIFGLVFIALTRRLLTRPLTQLTQATQGVSMETLETAAINLGRRDRDELAVFQDAFNAMTAKLLASRRQLQDLNTSLESHRADLERRVEERTEALALTNTLLRREIEDRERTQWALARSEANYRAIFDLANDAIFIHNTRTGRILNVNDRMLEMYGFADKAEVIGMHPGDLSTGTQDYSEQQAAQLLEQAAAGAPQLIEWQARDKAERAFWVEVNLKRAHIGDQDVVLAIVRDIDARKKAELKLIESEGKYRALFENEVDAISIFDAETRRLFDVNGAWLRLYGYRRDEALTMTTDGVSAEPAQTREAIRTATVSGSVYIPQRRHRRKDGTEFWVDVSAGPVTIAGQPMMYAIMRDITDRVVAQEALEASQAELQAIFASIPDVILIVDRHGRYLKVAPTSPNALYRPAEALLGKTIPQVFAPDQAAFFMAGIARCLRDRTLVTLQYDLEIDGHVVWFDARLAPMDDDRVLFAARDITEIKQFERRLRAAKETAEAANLAKSQFLANMSHEIRTPLNAVLGLTHLAQQTDLTPRQRDYLQKVDTSADTLLRLIDDILDFSKIEAGRLDLVAVDFSLRTVLSNVASVVRARGEAKGLAFAMRIDDDVPDLLVGDPVRLEQVLMNLGTNAVKFTRAGRIDIAVGTNPPNTEGTALRFTVTDTGIGIPPAHADRLFEPFHQVESSNTRSYGGTGLGLAICKRLVEMMDGTIGFESTPGQGSSFSFTAVLRPSDRADQPTPRLSETGTVENLLSGIRVLLAEDNDINRQVSQEVLEQAGATVRIAVNGRQAVEATETEPFDVVLMDIQMPDMDGLTATREIRDRAATATLPIIALTANAMAEDRRKCLQAGMNAHISKPIRPRGMYETILRLVRPGSRDTLSAMPAPPVTAPPDATALLPHDIPDLDTGHGLRHTNNDPALFMTILRAFHRNHRRTADEIDDALGQGDHATAGRLAHTLKSLAGTLGAHDVRAAARTLETAIDRRNQDEIGSGLRMFSEAMEAVMRPLDTALTNDAPPAAPDHLVDVDEDAIADLVTRLGDAIRDGRSDAAAVLSRLKAALGSEPVDGDGPFQALERCLADYAFDEAGEVFETIARQRGWET